MPQDVQAWLDARLEATGSARYGFQSRRKPSDLAVYTRYGKPQTKPLSEYPLLEIGRN